jgi:hypothetical protein
MPRPTERSRLAFRFSTAPGSTQFTPYPSAHCAWVYREASPREICINTPAAESRNVGIKMQDAGKR